MRKALAIAALAACIALGGCAPENGVVRGNGSAKENVDERFLCDDGFSCFSTVVDTKEGVVYLTWTHRSGESSVGGITPLLHEDGTPVMSEEVAR